jgi:hypothetical protein
VLAAGFEASVARNFQVEVVDEAVGFVFFDLNPSRGRRELSDQSLCELVDANAAGSVVSFRRRHGSVDGKKKKKKQREKKEEELL